MDTNNQVQSTCPKCAVTMALSATKETHNPRTGAQYDRRLYHCANDDIWISVEIPKADRGIGEMTAR